MMEINELRSAAYKILNSTLPTEFDFIERVKDVVLVGGENYFYITLKLKIVLKRDWVQENFLKDAMEYVNNDFEEDGYCLLSPFTVQAYSNEKIDTSKVDLYIHNILSFLGLKTDVSNIITSYIIE